MSVPISDGNVLGCTCPAAHRSSGDDVAIIELRSELDLAAPWHFDQLQRSCELEIHLLSPSSFSRVAAPQPPSGPRHEHAGESGLGPPLGPVCRSAGRLPASKITCVRAETRSAAPRATTPGVSV